MCEFFQSSYYQQLILYYGLTVCNMLKFCTGALALIESVGKQKVVKIIKHKKILSGGYTAVKILRYS